MMDRVDSRTPFERWCMRPGTRCAWIMRQIEKGASNREIAEALRGMKKLPQNRDVDAVTIEVYRKAYDGTLTTKEHHTPPSRVEERQARRDRILALYALGMTSREIAQETGFASSTVRTILAEDGHKQPKKPHTRRRRI